MDVLLVQLFALLQKDQHPLYGTGCRLDFGLIVAGQFQFTAAIHRSHMIFVLQDPDVAVKTAEQAGNEVDFFERDASFCHTGTPFVILQPL